MDGLNATDIADVVVVGAGPVGLFAVFQCGMLNMRCVVVDSLDAAGGQCAALYPDKPIYDIPGFPAVSGAEIADRLARQAAPFDPVFRLGTTVERIGGGGDRLLSLALSDGTSVVARAVIVAAGAGALAPNRPPLPGIEAYEGRSVLYSVTDSNALAGRRVVIAGGGDSAVDWANALAGRADKVFVVHRRPRFRGAPASVERMHEAAASGLLEIVVPYQLHGLHGDGSVLTAVTVVDPDGGTRELEADTLLAFFGLASHLGPIANWGLALDGQTIAVSPETCETSVPGVYAIGDIARYPGKLKLILTGFAEAATAAHAIYPRVHPGEVLHFEHSTTKGVPGARAAA